MPNRQSLIGFELTHTALDVLTPDQLDGSLHWLAAVVPGGVHESLVASGVIGHPYVGDNEQTIGWIEDEAWWYRTAFELEEALAGADRIRLVAHGLDTVADLWLNGEPLGHHENAFRPAEFDVATRLPARNTLVIRFAPPLRGVTVPPELAQTVALVRAALGGLSEGPDESGEPQLAPGVWSTGPELTLRRKPTFSWGWDFAPRVPSIGVWQPIELVADRGAVITGQHAYAVSLDAEHRRATVAVSLDVETVGPTEQPTATVVLTSPAGGRTETAVALSRDHDGTWRGDGVITVEDAQLWWTHDLGEQPLYGVAFVVGDDRGELTRVDTRIGLRTVTLDRGVDPDESARLFRFRLNGEPVYARGANWVPPSMLIGSVPDSTYRDLVGLAREANMTMLRVWGGGTYERDVFYDACDELGLLVWQEFMFACIDYPSDDPTLHAEVVREADHQVRRLRNHPSLALWCGNNEIHGMHQLIQGNVDPGNWGWSFFHQVLPDAVRRNNPSAVYWPGSPWAEVPEEINAVRDGDRHAWEVWHGLDVRAGGPTEFGSPGEAMHWTRYAYDLGRFISEFGLHAAPELATLRRWNPGETLELAAPALLRRIKDAPENKGDALMEFETGLPRTAEEFVEYSMVCQAEGLKFGVEHYRRRQPHNSGTLVWQLNDAWPGTSWSVIDYDLVPKAGYYALQRAYVPVLASFRVGDEGLELWVTNSTLAPVAGTARVEVARFAGGHVVDEVVAVRLDAMESRMVWRATVELSADVYAWVSSPDQLFPANRLFFDRLKNIDFGPCELSASIERTGATRAAVTLTAHGFNFLSRLTTGHPGSRFSSNYLDLRDGDKQLIEVTGLPADVDLRAITVASFGPAPAFAVIGKD